VIIIHRGSHPRFRTRTEVHRRAAIARALSGGCVKDSTTMYGPAAAGSWGRGASSAERAQSTIRGSEGPIGGSAAVLLSPRCAVASTFAPGSHLTCCSAGYVSRCNHSATQMLGPRWASLGRAGKRCS